MLAVWIVRGANYRGPASARSRAGARWPSMSDPPFGSMVRRYRRDAGLTQEELADRAGLSTRTISDLERGLNSTPQAATLDMLCEALNLSPEARLTLMAAAPRRRHPIPQANRDLSLVPLPAEMTPLIGREKDEATAIHLLRSRRLRLLTLIGPGGVGKTRLGLRVAETISGDYAAGVGFVSLAAVTSPDMLPSAIRTAVGILDSRGAPPIEALCTWLRDYQLLLVLDNFEHLAQAAPMVASLLAGCPLLTVLATSRVPLRLRGEQLLEVPPLQAPLTGEEPTAEVAIGYSAVELFVRRTMAVRPEFALTDDKVSTVTDICRRLDSLPLAIELAAGQSRHLSTDSVLDRLKRGIDTSSLAPVDAPVRQQTMWDTIAWSYELLKDDESHVFRAVSVFVGSFSLEAAERVAGTDGRDVLFVLDALVAKSLLLLRTDGAGEPRYSMLETVREHGALRAKAAEETADLRDRHALFFLGLARLAYESVREHGVSWLSSRLQADHENMLAALGWLRENGRVGAALELAGELAEYWIPWGYVGEGRHWIDDLLERAAEAGDKDPVDVPPAALTGAARLAWLQTEYDRAVALYEDAVVAYQRAGDAGGEATTLNNLGAVAHMRSDYDSAVVYYERAIEFGRRAQRPRSIAMSVSNLGLIALHRGEYERAEELLDEGVALWRAVGDEQLLAVTLGNLGSLAFRQGRYDDAVTIQEQALSLKQKAGDALAVAKSLGDLALAEVERGNDGRAEELLGDALKVFDRTGQKDAVAEALEGMAGIARRRGELARAARLYGGAAAIRDDIRAPHRPVDLPRHEAALAELRDRMSPTALDRAWRVGQQLQLEDLVKDALSVDPSLTSGVSGSLP